MAGSTASNDRQAALSQPEKPGHPALARPVIAPATNDKEAFTRIVVGQSQVSGKAATVSFTVVRPPRTGVAAALSAR